MKKLKTVFGISLVSGALFAAVTFAGGKTDREKYEDCLKHCQGSCTVTGRCFWEIE